MDVSNLNALSFLIRNLFDYFEVLPSNVEEVERYIVRSTRKRKGVGDWFLSFNKHCEEKVRLCVDGKVTFDAKQACDDLPNISKKWPISITICDVRDNGLILSFNRSESFREVIKEVLKQGADYGRSLNDCHEFVQIRYCNNINETSSDMTEIRVALAAQVIGNLYHAVGYNVKVNQTLSENQKAILNLYLTHKSTDCNMPTESKCVACGVVLNTETGCKEKQIMAADYYRYWEDNVCKVFDGKISCNVIENQSDIKSVIARAGVLIDLLSVKLNSCIFLRLSKIENPQCHGVNSKGAPFILYNTARLASLQSQFQRKVSLGEYPKLPSFDQVDYSLLICEEEWTLLFQYVMSFPQVIKEALLGCEEGKPNIHIFVSFLNSFCKNISVYYRRVRILTDSRSQLLPVMFARLYLLQAIQQILHNALCILGIKPISQM